MSALPRLNQCRFTSVSPDAGAGRTRLGPRPQYIHPTLRRHCQNVFPETAYSIEEMGDRLSGLFIDDNSWNTRGLLRLDQDGSLQLCPRVALAQLEVDGEPGPEVFTLIKLSAATLERLRLLSGYFQRSIEAYVTNAEVCVLPRLTKLSINFQQHIDGFFKAFRCPSLLELDVSLAMYQDVVNQVPRQAAIALDSNRITRLEISPAIAADVISLVRNNAALVELSLGVQSYLHLYEAPENDELDPIWAEEQDLQKIFDALAEDNIAVNLLTLKVGGLTDSVAQRLIQMLEKRRIRTGVRELSRLMALYHRCDVDNEPQLEVVYSMEERKQRLERYAGVVEVLTARSKCSSASVSGGYQRWMYLGTP